MVEFSIHDWLKTSCRDGLQVQVLLRVIYACVVQLEDTADLGSVALWYEGSRPFAGNMLQWCKWKTRLAKAQMPYGMRVRFSPEAKICSGGAIGRRSCLKNSFRKNCEFESHPEHHRILAQLELERPTSNRQVIGSNPICPTRVCNSVVECTAHNRVGGGSIPSIPILLPVVQLVECVIWGHEVAGSNPARQNLS